MVGNVISQRHSCPLSPTSSCLTRHHIENIFAVFLSFVFVFLFFTSALFILFYFLALTLVGSTTQDYQSYSSRLLACFSTYVILQVHPSWKNVELLSVNFFFSPLPPTHFRPTHYPHHQCPSTFQLPPSLCCLMATS